jgi:hypothetical protein
VLFHALSAHLGQLPRRSILNRRVDDLCEKEGVREAAAGGGGGREERLVP